MSVETAYAANPTAADRQAYVKAVFGRPRVAVVRGVSAGSHRGQNYAYLAAWAKEHNQTLEFDARGLPVLASK